MTLTKKELETLQACPEEPFTCAELAEIIGIAKTTSLQRINALVQLGILTKSKGRRASDQQITFEIRERGRKLRAAETVNVVDRGGSGRWQHSLATNQG